MSELDKNRIRPFIKWVGGKSQLLESIRTKYPTQTSDMKYCEPFVGGGAVLFDIILNCNFNKILINDVNCDLINTYKVIQQHPHNLIKSLITLQNAFIPLQLEDRKIFYYEMRDKYNKAISNNSQLLNVEKAALFIFLNRTCFNGLYRVNSRGMFNVPMGDYKNPQICDTENILNVSKCIQKIEIICGDFYSCKPFIDKNTFVYIDPPYRPISKTSSFTSYTQKEFSDDEQIRLGRFINEINIIGASIVLSNSDPKNMDSNDNFFDELYQGYEILRVNAKRMINSDSKKRGNIYELLVSNC